MSRIHFFATTNDLRLLFGQVEGRISLQYREADRLLGPVPAIWNRVYDIPFLGEASADQEILCTPVLIMKKGVEVTVNCFSVRGSEIYDAYPVDNLDSALLRAGGVWQDRALISGHVIPSSDSTFARSVMYQLRKFLKKDFVKINAFWVGREAEVLWKSGMRLCSAVQSPPEYDLREID